MMHPITYTYLIHYLVCVNWGVLFELLYSNKKSRGEYFVNDVRSNKLLGASLSGTFRDKHRHYRTLLQDKVANV